jgi:thioredoxin 1
MMAADTASDAGTTTTSEPLHTNGQSQLDEIVAEHDAV